MGNGRPRSLVGVCALGATRLTMAMAMGHNATGQYLYLAFINDTSHIPLSNFGFL